MSLFSDDLHRYLLACHEVDERRIDAPDIFAKWPDICAAYIPDGLREFAHYPTVSLGWMMYVGMAVAQCWDDDWTTYDAVDNLYVLFRDKRGYDAMDEYIRSEVLHLSGDAYAEMERIVGECAARSESQLRRTAEPGTPAAFHAYRDALFALYEAGAALWLHRLGYKMCKVDMS